MNYKKTCIMGDTNCVLDDINRSPAHADNKKVTNQLRKTMRKYKLLDSWRIQNPEKKKNTPSIRKDHVLRKELIGCTYQENCMN